MFLFQLRRKRNGDDDRDRHDDDDDFDDGDDDEEEDEAFEDDGNSGSQDLEDLNRNIPDDDADVQKEAYEAVQEVFGPFKADRIKGFHHDKTGGKDIIRIAEITNFRSTWQRNVPKVKATLTKKMAKKGKSYWIQSLKEKLVKKLRNHKKNFQKLLNDPGKLMRAFMIRRIFPLLQNL